MIVTDVGAASKIMGLADVSSATGIGYLPV